MFRFLMSGAKSEHIRQAVFVFLYYTLLRTAFEAKFSLLPTNFENVTLRLSKFVGFLATNQFETFYTTGLFVYPVNTIPRVVQSRSASHSFAQRGEEFQRPPSSFSSRVALPHTLAALLYLFLLLPPLPLPASPSSSSFKALVVIDRNYFELPSPKL